MTILRAVLLAFAIFSRIPVPKAEWSEQNMRYIMAAFPLVGAAAGLSLIGWAALCRWLSLGAVLTACGMTLIPIAVTGGIHLDGFCDTADARASHSDPGHKCEILKDPHLGAFAAIWLTAYFLLYFSLCYTLLLSRNVLLLLLCVHILSRICSAFAVIFLPGTGAAGTLQSFETAADKKTVAAVLTLMLLACAAFMLSLSATGGAVLLTAALCCWLNLKHTAQKEFGGMRGDLAGWFLQRCELLCLAALVFLQKGGWL